MSLRPQMHDKEQGSLTRWHSQQTAVWVLGFSLYGAPKLRLPAPGLLQTSMTGAKTSVRDGWDWGTPNMISKNWGASILTNRRSCLQNPLLVLAQEALDAVHVGVETALAPRHASLGKQISQPQTLGNISAFTPPKH